MNVIILKAVASDSLCVLFDLVSAQKPFSSELSHNLQADCHPMFQHGLFFQHIERQTSKEIKLFYTSVPLADKTQTHTHTQELKYTNISSLKGTAQVTQQLSLFYNSSSTNPPNKMANCVFCSCAFFFDLTPPTNRTALTGLTLYWRW